MVGEALACTPYRNSGDIVGIAQFLICSVDMDFQILDQRGFLFFCSTCHTMLAQHWLFFVFTYTIYMPFYS